MGGSTKTVLYAYWKSEDMIPHQNRLITHNTPYPVTLVAAPMVNTNISELQAVTLV